jgi:cell division protein FtsB
MKKNELRKTVTGIVSEKTFSDSISKTRKAVECVNGMFEAIDVDKESFKNKIDCLIDKSGNTLNAILHLFGLKMINGKKLEWECEKDIDLFDDIIKLDVNKFTLELENMIKILSEFERTIYQQLDENQKKIKEQFRENEKLKNDINQINSQSIIRENQILASLQQIISLEYAGNGKDSEIYNQIVEMLEDMGIKVYWDNDGKETEFQVLNITKERQGMLVKPCFMHGNEVVLKGLKYQMVSAEATDNAGVEE